MSAGHKWKPLKPSAIQGPPGEALVAAAIKCLGERGLPNDRASALASIKRELEGVEYFRNDLYQVEVRRYPDAEMVHLNIRRVDGYPGRDWRHFQQIKNELVGSECEGVEIYPAESRLTDTSNKYHLYCFTDPTYRIPFGFWDRDVQPGCDSTPGLRQRPAMRHARGR